MKSKLLKTAIIAIICTVPLSIQANPLGSLLNGFSNRADIPVEVGKESLENLKEGQFMSYEWINSEGQCARNIPTRLRTSNH